MNQIVKQNKLNTKLSLTCICFQIKNGAETNTS